MHLALQAFKASARRLNCIRPSQNKTFSYNKPRAQSSFTTSSTTLNSKNQSTTPINTANMSTTHQAAILESKGTPLKLTTRPTPTPTKPNELLIAVHSVALNPIDYYMRDYGFFVAHYPTVVGSDVAGTVLSSTDPALPAGTRVAAFAPCFFTQGLPDYGALQTRALVPAANATPLPDNVSFNDASLLPMSVATAWSGFYSIGIPTTGAAYAPSDKKAMLVWGGASSIGSGAVQAARLLGFRVYATASPRHHAYIKSLGAAAVVDYKAADPAAQLVAAAKADGLHIKYAFDAAGAVQECLDVLAAFGPGGKLAEAKPVNEQTPRADGVETKFVLAPSDPAESERFFHFVMREWLRGKLASGEYVASPGVKVVPGGLGKADEALDELKAGVSGVKLVLEV